MTPRLGAPSPPPGPSRGCSPGAAPSEEPMDLKAAVRSVLLGWYYPALGILIACGVAVFLHSREAPVYEADATYVVTPYAGPTESDTTESVKTLDATRSRSIMTTLTEIVISETARTEAAAVLGVET